MRKSIISSVLVVILFLMVPHTGGKDKSTLKEKIESNKPVKIFFIVTDIYDKQDERKLQQGNSKAKTHIRTAMPEEFYSSEIKTKVVRLLNDGLEVGNAFEEGDVSTLPESDNYKTKYKDLTKLPDGFYSIISITGEYTRFLEKKEVEGKTVFTSTNKMQIKSHLFFFDVTSGKVKSYGPSNGTLLGHASSASTNTDKYESLEYMEANFPALPLLNEYIKTMYEYVDDFTKRKLKKHKKTVAKRK